MNESGRLYHPGIGIIKKKNLTHNPHTQSYFLLQ